MSALSGSSQSIPQHPPAPPAAGHSHPPPRLGPQTPVVQSPLPPQPALPPSPPLQPRLDGTQEEPGIDPIPHDRGIKLFMGFAANLIYRWSLRALVGRIRPQEPPQEPHPEREPFHHHQRRRVGVPRSRAGMPVQRVEDPEPLPRYSPPPPYQPTDGESENSAASARW